MTKLQELGFKTTEDGLAVTQLDGDMGDSPQKTSMAHIGLIATKQGSIADFSQTVETHFLGPGGLFVRDQDKWNDTSEFSRDQQDPLTIAAGLYGLEWITRRAPWFKYQNKDIGSPMTWALNIRARRWSGLHWLLYLFDLGLLISVLITILDRDPDSVDDDNLLCRLIQSQLVLSTPVSWLARKLYSRFRPWNYGNVYKVETNHIMGAIAWKHRPESGGNTAMIELWRPIVMKYF